MIKLAQRVFSEIDQKHFAAVSGDYNPMHMDALLARRTQAGAPVVHGINLFLWALDSFAAAIAGLPPLRGVRARFNRFFYVGESAEVILASRGLNGARLNISSGGVPRSKVSLTFGDAANDCPVWDSSSLERIPFSMTALDPSFEEMSDRSGMLSFRMTPEDAAALYPAATKWIGARRIAAFAASTQLVGMVCPGLHSIYSELSANICDDAGSEDSLAFRVSEVDTRFRSVDQEIAGAGLRGTVYSSSRTPPVQQATMESIAGLVNPQEFTGSLAMVVGGSRGLGELTAKLLATGGARLLITWQTGRIDAERVATEIRSAGRVCATLPYDARKSAREQLAELAEAPTHAYYFATPPIFRSTTGFFSLARLQEFMNFYVDGFWHLSEALSLRQSRLSVFYPSSVSVTERPRGMTEYTMSKVAGEVLCADMNESLTPLHVTVGRLPRLLTDQTASVTPVETSSPVETMLPIIREVQSWPR